MPDHHPFWEVAPCLQICFVFNSRTMLLTLLLRLILYNVPRGERLYTMASLPLPVDDSFILSGGRAMTKIRGRPPTGAATIQMTRYIRFPRRLPSRPPPPSFAPLSSINIFLSSRRIICIQYLDSVAACRPLLPFVASSHSLYTFGFRWWLGGNCLRAPSSRSHDVHQRRRPWRR